MSLFNPMQNTQAYLKCGILGFAGSGKSTTATNIAVGLVDRMRESGLEDGNKPVMFLDTESGSDWLKNEFDKHSIELSVCKQRAFKSLVEAIPEAEENGSVLIIDSISHCWTELMESYTKKKNRNYGLQFQDWAVLKKSWRTFTDLYINSNVHIILCGRAAHEFDYFQNENGKKELEKTGVKMSAEKETGYEASLLILMQREQVLKDGKPIGQQRTATILKDRSGLIDGQIFSDPTFKHLRPHIDCLNLGGNQLGVDTTTNSEDMFDSEGRPRWQVRKEQKDLALEEIKDILSKYHPGASVSEKTNKADIVEKVFNTRTWARVENLDCMTVQQGRNAIWEMLEKKPYHYSNPDFTPELNDEIPDFKPPDPVEPEITPQQENNPTQEM